MKHFFHGLSKEIIEMAGYINLGDHEPIDPTPFYPKAIALIGNKGSGKDTVANILVEHYGYTRVAFADKLKEIIADLYNLDLEMLKGLTPEARILREAPYKQLGYKSAREALQLFGTEVCRTVYKNTWVDYLIRQIKANPDKRYVITDCRFENEVMAIAQLEKSQIWAINRPGTDPKWYQLWFGRLHQSERDVPRLKRYADQDIDNNETLEYLAYQVSFALTRYKKLGATR